MKTIIIRHRRENRKKCTLTPLEKRLDFKFLPYPNTPLFDPTNCVLLDFDGPLLSKAQAKKTLVVIDSLWRYVPKIKAILPKMPSFSLPPFKTAYPRKQEDCQDPTRGMASIEAIYVAYTLLGWDTKGLLDHYHFREEFLSKNNFDHGCQD